MLASGRVISGTSVRKNILPICRITTQNDNKRTDKHSSQPTVNITQSRTSTSRFTPSSVIPLWSPSASWYQASDSTLLISQKLNQPWLTADMMPFRLFTRQLNIKHSASLLKPASFSHPQGQSLTPEQWQNRPRSSPRIAQDRIRLYFLWRALKPILHKR